MTVLEAFWLGLLQGVTEFLPISSSGHLAMMHALMGAEQAQQGNMAYDIFLHVATLIAVVGYFWRDWLALVRSAWTLVEQLRKNRQVTDPQSKLLCMIVLATIPAALLGVLCADKVEALFYGEGVVWRIAALFVVTGAAFLLAERLAAHRRSLSSLTVKDAGIVGLLQALSLLPGISRSGSTMVGALFLGFNRTDAARFSFLLAVPITAGAAILKVPEMLVLGEIGVMPLLVGFVTALVSAIFTIHYLLKLLKNYSYKVFAWYLLGVGGLVLAYTWVVA